MNTDEIPKRHIYPLYRSKGRVSAPMHYPFPIAISATSFAWKIRFNLAYLVPNNGSSKKSTIQNSIKETVVNGFALWAFLTGRKQLCETGN